ncbi:type II secretion system protein F [Intrasporangium oryzae NRRL B-24470]|uniref:Type II secretion system protein F n=1 Tax=Intrasporangium oryzae NRRL B-24470 TaxID=1386089 RepID=W9GC86_9MICO|nr:type II secretion system F family protein [Intrasporangium oryzae]EWT03675.1 type II secretion system protein F [Intrasporangium oryzae NRRL B-24470]
MTHPILKRIAVTLTLGVGAVLAVGGPATAADPVTVSMTQIASTETGVTGVLTVRSVDPVEIDPASLTASIDGELLPVTLQKKTERTERRSMLVIDTSGSMGTSGMATVRSATAAYLRVVPDDVLVGVTSFATTAGVDLAPTRDRAAVQRVVNGLASRGDTSLYAAVLDAVRGLGATGDRSIVLLSDGADTLSTNKDADLARAVAALRSGGIRVDVVRFNTNDPDATTALRSFASVNGGSVVAASNSTAVTNAFRASAKALDAQSQFLITTPKKYSGKHSVVVRGTAGASDFRVVQDVNLAAAAAAPTPSPTATRPAVALPATASIGAAPNAPWAIWLAAGLVGLAAFLIAAGSLIPTTSKRQLRVASIEQYIAATTRQRSRSEGKTHSAPLAEQIVGIGERVMRDRRATKSTMALIERADLPFRAGEWLVLRVVSVVVVTSVFYVMFRSHQLLGITIGMLIGIFGPPAILRFLARRRAKAFERILPDVLMLVATSLRSGFGLPQALDAVARDAAEPAAKEFSRALAETRIGTEIPDALERMAERMDSTSMRWTVMAMRVQREVGGNLAETLTTTAATLRERESLHRQVQTLSAEGRLSAAILIALPFFVFIYMLFVNYAYVSLLWTTTLGLVLSVFGCVMLVIGVFWMRRVVKIEV